MEHKDRHELLALRAIFESMENAVITHDLNNTILDCNPAAEQLFAIPANELRGQSFYTLIPDGLRGEQDEIIGRLMKGERISHLKSIRLSSDKKRIPVSITVSPVKDGKGSVIGVSHIIRHIEGEMEAEEKNNRLASIIEGSADAIISKTLLGYITSWNKGAEQIFGYTAEEIIGRHITTLIPEDRASEEDIILHNIRQGNKIEHFETIRKNKRGELIPISLTVSPIRDGSGQIVGVSKIARNISHKVADERRRATLAAIVENSDDAIISKTLDGIITSWNRGAEKIFGHKEEDVIGKHISIIIPDERLNEENEILGNIRAGRTVDHFQTKRVKKDGSLVDISITVSPVKDRSGNIIGASKIARDITAQKHAEALISDLNKKKDEFIAMASHELKTPLTSMKGYLQLLENRLSGDDRQFAEKILRQQERLNTLVNDLFDISKIRAGKLDFSFSVFNLSEMIRETIEPIREANPAFQILADLPEEIQIEADEMRLQQVITNLLSNAMKYSPNGGTIELSAKLSGSNLHLSVSDQGLGIAPGNLLHIFEQFYREESKNVKTSGLGLGLYITNEIIKRHGGRIWVESEVGKGSTFSFTQPISQGHNQNKVL